MRWLVLAVIACLVGCGGRSATLATAATPVNTGAQDTPLMTAEQLIALPHSPPDFRLRYDSDSSQYGELRVPSDAELHPVVVLIHGGCWRADFARASSIAAMADALKDLGVATWSIEYRRLGEPGAGWPGTYVDVGNAVDHLRAIAEPYHLDLARVIVVGHSAGGHLAMWVASRARIPRGSTLYRADALPMRGVVDLSGTPDMAENVSGMNRTCGDTVVQKMTGGVPTDVPVNYSQTSAVRMLPLGIPQRLIWGARDDQVPLYIAEQYTRAAKRAGDDVRLVVDSTAGHFEAASPRSTLWPAVRSAVRQLLGAPATGRAPSRTSVIMLGTGNPTLDPDRMGPATIILVDSTAYLVDAGVGVVRRWAAAGRAGLTTLKPWQLHRLFVTHLHSDHTLGFAELIFSTWTVAPKPRVPLQVYGPRGTRAMADHLLAAYVEDIGIRTGPGGESEGESPPRVNVQEITPGVVYRDSLITVTAFAVHHGTFSQAFGYRFQTPDRDIVISGDAAPPSAIPAQCHGCDILIHEGGFYHTDDASTYRRQFHTSMEELLDIARTAHPKLLVLYHQPRGNNDAGLRFLQAGFDGRVVVAKDLDVF